MKKINLAESFEKLSSTISSLPLTHYRISRNTKKTFQEMKMKQLLREIYEAANGRQVATTIGLVAVAPPIAPHLKDKPFYVETQADFLAQAIARIADRKRPTGVGAEPRPSSPSYNRASPKSTGKRSSERRKGSCMRVE